ncbi:hypothetical protein Taro_026830 [Colocasia esculenta]|uniref:Serine aminopeptidase S33 domain-containing protein n=1 Tax=Colocasia esculenta TaxID=4460 RepID=A0A843VDZ0_COLES|nr:hypothetical protein [Colocasia esculenta]
MMKRLEKLRNRWRDRPLTPEEFYSQHGVAHTTSTYRNPRGLNIFNQFWVPLAGDPAGILCVVRGFTGESNWFLQLTSIFVEHGRFTVCALDHQGHGFSDGLQAHIPDINPVVDDCLSVFDAFRACFPPSLPGFLYSGSLGGAIALLVHLRSKDQESAESRRWDDAIVNDAMWSADKGSPSTAPEFSLVQAIEESESFLSSLKYFMSGMEGVIEGRLSEEGFNFLLGREMPEKIQGHIEGFCRGLMGNAGMEDFNELVLFPRISDDVQAIPSLPVPEVFESERNGSPPTWVIIGVYK